MTPEEEVAALKRWAALLRAEARRADHGIPLLEYDDLYQMASLALLRAIPTYDGTKRASMFTWLRRKIRWALADYIRETLPGRRSFHDQVTVLPADEKTITWFSDQLGNSSPDVADSDSLVLQDFLAWWVRYRQPKREWVIVVALRLSGSNLMDAGRAAGLSEARASQIMKLVHQDAAEYGRSQESSPDD